MNVKRTKEQKAWEREAARLARAEAVKALQSQGYGFEHDIPARAIPKDIREMAEMVAPGSGCRWQVEEAARKFVTRNMRAARI